MNKNRLEAFSDAVLAIIMTIMVLDLKVPHDPTWQNYVDAYPIFASYALSFVFIGLYWSNHHHLFHEVSKVDNKILWLNMFTLFWESLIPFVTGSMGENHFSNITVAMYSIVMTFSTIAHICLVKALQNLHGTDSRFSRLFEGHFKGYATIFINTMATLLALAGFPRLAFILMCLIALAWFLPHHRISSTSARENS